MWTEIRKCRQAHCKSFQVFQIWAQFQKRRKAHCKTIQLFPMWTETRKCRKAHCKTIQMFPMWTQSRKRRKAHCKPIQLFPMWIEIRQKNLNMMAPKNVFTVVKNPHTTLQQTRMKNHSVVRGAKRNSIFHYKMMRTEGLHHFKLSPGILAEEYLKNFQKSNMFWNQKM